MDRRAPYFGSWTFSHEIPAEQMAAIEQSEFVWLSHGHPDHLNQDSLSRLKDKTILLPNHVGQIIWQGLRDRGYRVRILEDNVWTKLSDGIRILCLCDLNQDGVLLVDVNGRLLVDLNDGGALGWQSYIRKLVRQAPVSFLLKLFAGEADMRNFFDEQGRRIPLVPKSARAPLGGIIQHDAEHMGVSYVIPFSSFHKIQRADSVWVQEFIHEPEDTRSASRPSAPPCCRRSFASIVSATRGRRSIRRARPTRCCRPRRLATTGTSR